MKYLFFLFSIAGLVSVNSCSKAPFACFLVDHDIDSIPVNKPIQFNSFCSNEGQDYFWDFNNGDRYYDPVIDYTFTDTGKYEVFLLVTNGKKTASTTRILTVRP
jgi:PKD repeat protein